MDTPVLKAAGRATFWERYHEVRGVETVIKRVGLEIAKQLFQAHAVAEHDRPKVHETALRGWDRGVRRAHYRARAPIAIT
jgi:hypothetical protein